MKPGRISTVLTRSTPTAITPQANIRWHYVQAGNYAAARPWLERSLRLYGNGNDIARFYLDTVERKLVEMPPAGAFCPPVFERKWRGIPS